MTKGSFKIVQGDNGDFNIKPLDLAVDIPEDQRQLHKEIYRAYNALKLLVEHNVLGRDHPEFLEFRGRLLEAAEVGLAAKTSVKTQLAATAVKDIGEDIVTRKGKRVVYSYLARLGGWASVPVVIAALVHVYDGLIIPLTVQPYFLVVAGAMAGAWLSVVSGRTNVALDTIHQFLDYGREPVIRLVFVAFLALALGLFLQEGLIKIEIGAVDLKTFTTEKAVALILGLVIGISEKALSLTFLERTKKYVVT